MPSAKSVALNGALMMDLGDGQGTRWPVSDNDPLRASYGVFLPNIVPAANPTDLITIRGSASKTIRLRSVVITGAATTASNIILALIKRSAANTGGTSTNPTIIQRDTNDDAATALIAQYTANPSGLGASLGSFDGARLNIAPAANGGIDRVAFQYGWLNDKAPILRGVSEFFALNLGGAVWPAGGALDVAIAWTED